MSISDALIFMGCMLFLIGVFWYQDHSEQRRRIERLEDQLERTLDAGEGTVHLARKLRTELDEANKELKMLQEDEVPL